MNMTEFTGAGGDPGHRMRRAPAAAARDAAPVPARPRHRGAPMRRPAPDLADAGRPKANSIICLAGASPRAATAIGVLLGLCLSAVLIVLIAAGMVSIGVSRALAGECCIVAVLVSFGTVGGLLQWRRRHPRDPARPFVPNHAAISRRAACCPPRRIRSVASVPLEAVPACRAAR